MQKIIQRYRYSAVLLRELVRTDFQLRYQGSALGYLWSLLRPLFMFTILYFVFVRFLKFSSNVQHPAVYLLLGIVLWNYFVEVTTASVGAIVSKGDLIRKINFPKYVIILAGSLGALINLLFNFVVVGIFMVFNHVQLAYSALLIIPIVIELFVFSLAVAFILSALFVKYRDITYIWDIVIQAGFYLTPILYLPSKLPHYFAQIIFLSPLAQLIQDARHVLVTTQSTTLYNEYSGDKLLLLVPVALTIAVAVIGMVYFRAQSKNFAEEV